jgi:hypothetical protein
MVLGFVERKMNITIKFSGFYQCSSNLEPPDTQVRNIAVRTTLQGITEQLMYCSLYCSA